MNWTSLRQILKRKRFGISASRLLSGVVLMAAGAIFLGYAPAPGDMGSSLRMAASDIILSPAPADMPLPIYSHTDGNRIWAIRQAASVTTLPPAFVEAIQFIRDAQFLAASQKPVIKGPAVMMPLLSQDGATAPHLLASAPHDHAEVLDSHGRPLRWQLSENILSAYSKPRPYPYPAPVPIGESVNPKFTNVLTKLAPARNAGNYRDLVESFARRFNLSTELVMAIIHSESNFSPRLVSSKSAMGLMQLLPSTASGEVHKFLYGTRGNVSFEQLANPEINIRYGTAYLHILHNRYFCNVKDKQVREACVIASYNLGPNRFLKLYGPNNQQAVENINRMTPAEFHADLPKRLPVRETRYYVEKVKRMKQHYSGLQ